MTPQIWIGFAFFATLLVFLIFAFFKTGGISTQQSQILRLLSALCAGFGGAFLTGEAVVKIDAEYPGLKMAVSGTAGVGLFLLVWFTWKSLLKDQIADSFSFSIPQGWTFEQVARTIAISGSGTIEFINFPADKLAIILPSQEIHTDDAKQALKRLRHLASDIPNYTVTSQGTHYKLTI